MFAEVLSAGVSTRLLLGCQASQIGCHVSHTCRDLATLYCDNNDCLLLRLQLPVATITGVVPSTVNAHQMNLPRHAMMQLFTVNLFTVLYNMVSNQIFQNNHLHSNMLEFFLSICPTSSAVLVAPHISPTLCSEVVSGRDPLLF